MHHEEIVERLGCRLLVRPVDVHLVLVDGLLLLLHPLQEFLEPPPVTVGVRPNLLRPRLEVLALLAAEDLGLHGLQVHERAHALFSSSCSITASDAIPLHLENLGRLRGRVVVQVVDLLVGGVDLLLRSCERRLEV